MAIVVTALTDYVDENKLELISKSISGAKSIKLMNIQTGVKGSTAINLMKTDVVFQSGASCGWNASGDTTLSQRMIVSKPVKINDSFCDVTLLKKWAGQEVRVAAGFEKLPFEQKFTNGVVDGVNENLELGVWQGDTAGSGNLAMFDGLLKIIGAEDTSIKKVMSVSGVKEAVDATYKLVPSAILNTVALFMGQDSFREYSMALTAANLYHYNPTIDGEMTIVIPGTSTKIYGVPGLDGTGKIVAADPENLYYGTDMENDEEKFDFWYSKDNQEFRLAIKFLAGVQVAFPDQVVLTTIKA